MSPASDGPHLVLVPPRKGERGVVYSLREGKTSIGRAHECDVRVADSSVSRIQCRLMRSGGEVRVHDVGRNPTRVGNEAANGLVLRDGDVLRVGRSKLLFRAGRGGRPSPAPRGRPSPRERGRSPHRHPPAPARRGRLRRFRRRPSHAPVIAVAAITLVGAVVALTYYRGTTSTLEEEIAASRASATEAPPAPPASRPAAPLAIERPPAETSLAPVEAASVTVDVPERSGDGDDDRWFDVDSDGDPAAEDQAEATDEPDAGVVEVATVPLAAGSAREAYFRNQIVPFLGKYCTSCHGAEEPKGDLALHGYAEESEAVADREVWELVARKLRAGEMPPEKADGPRPDAAEVKSVIGWIDAAVFGAGAEGGLDPGRVTMRRLNRHEYNFTVRDLVGLDLRLADAFPGDDIGYGFDTIGDILSIPPLLMEKYLAAAEKVVDAALKDDRARGRILVCEPKRKSEFRSCARRIIREFASRAFRRPATTTEVSRLAGIVDVALKTDGDDGGFEAGLRLALQAILVSPHFLFRVELDSRPDDPRAVRSLTDWELASRLSYFLWSSMPDDELFELARKKELGRDEVLEQQVKRMLADAKARGLVETFASLWLGTRALADVTPDPATYPEFDEALRQAMRRETERYFEEVMRGDLRILLFLDSDFTFVNERLARHYGIGGVVGKDLLRVDLAGHRRGGVLTQASVLTVTSNPTRTSPVKRGKWILEQILGAPPPPPPPGADNLAEVPEGEAVSFRARMEQHRRDPNCAVCHEKMDTIGLAFENYDGIGGWRGHDGTLPIDASGKLPDGRSFEDVRELKKILLENYALDFARCLTEKMFTFALGRGLEYTDTGEVDRIARKVADEGYRFSSLVVEIVRSDLFRKRRGERKSQ